MAKHSCWVKEWAGKAVARDWRNISADEVEQGLERNESPAGQRSREAERDRCREERVEARSSGHAFAEAGTLDR